MWIQGICCRCEVGSSLPSPRRSLTLSPHSGIAVNGSVYFKGKYHPVGLFHCNNRASLPLYETYVLPPSSISDYLPLSIFFPLRLVQFYRRYYASFFTGSRGSQLLRGLHALWDDDYKSALQLYIPLLDLDLSIQEENFLRVMLEEMKSMDKAERNGKEMEVAEVEIDGLSSTVD